MNDQVYGEMPIIQKAGQMPTATPSIRAPGRLGIGLLLIIGLIAFEAFNFDTTRYALLNLMGDVSFAGLRWAAVLATAFCAIDFAGLLRIFSPTESERPAESWYLMGAWLLGATMNALMTWWAVSLTLLNHDLGNEVLSRAQLLEVVPVFVAVLVWLTRILFIGALAVAGDHLFADLRPQPTMASGKPTAVQKPAAVRPRVQPARQRHPSIPSRPFPVMTSSNDLPPFMNERRFQEDDLDELPHIGPRRESSSRIRQRPPMPAHQRRAASMSAQPRR